MASITILHLSDLQSGNLNSWWAHRDSWVTAPKYGEIFHTKLADILSDAIHIIIVTGDIAERGKDIEYDAAWAFLDKLRNSLQEKFYLRPEVYIVLSNHDIDRDADKSNENTGARARFQSKLAAYNRFVKSFDQDLCSSYTKPMFVKRMCIEDLDMILVGLNSCIQESYEPEDHYGWVGNTQLAQVRAYLERRAVGPSSLKIAAFHHHPLLIGSSVQTELDTLFNTASGDSKKHAADLRNYLHNPDKVLKELTDLGFVIALHGHQHFDGVLNVSFPGRYGEPFARYTISLIGAGSAGLQHGTPPQPSVSSAQVLKIETVPWGWHVVTRRITFIVIGSVRPNVVADLDEAKTLILPRGQPLEAISGVTDGFKLVEYMIGKARKRNGDSDPWPGREKPADFEKYVLWTAPGLGARVGALPPPLPSPKPLTVLLDEMLRDFQTVSLHGIRNWAEGERIYGNDEMLALRALEIENDIPQVSIQVRRFAETGIINWTLPLRILQDGNRKVSFREKWLLRRLRGPRTIENNPYLSWRNEVTVLATVRRASGDRDLIVRVRSGDVAISRGRPALFTSGGCRPRESGQSDDYIKDPHGTLRESALREMQRETGFILQPHDGATFHLVALYLDPLNFTAVWLYWLDMTEAEFKKYKNRRHGRDEYEAWKYFRIRLHKAENWKGLKDRIECETNGKMEMSADPALGLWVWLRWMSGLELRS